MLEIILFIIIVALDQASKAYCASWLATLPNKTYPLIQGVFSLSYVENKGAAFGMLQNMRVLFIIATAVVCGVMVYILIKDHKKMHLLMRIALALILAGAVGNFIDRTFIGFVRDMFYFELINFAVFNVADAAISVGAVTLVLDILFFKGRKYLMDEPRKDGANKGEA
jgi:signal peptidase II